jgi:hypothetical protein
LRPSVEILRVFYVSNQGFRSVKTGVPRLNFDYSSRSIQVRNDTELTHSRGEKTMKKIMVILILLSTLILAGVLYGTSSLKVDEQAALSLEEAYRAQYPTEMPDVMFDQVPYAVF